MGVDAYLFVHLPRIYARVGRMRHLVDALEGEHGPQFEALRSTRGVDAEGLQHLLAAHAHTLSAPANELEQVFFIMASLSRRYAKSRFSLLSELVLDSHTGASAFSAEDWQLVDLLKLHPSSMASHRREWADIVSMCPFCHQGWPLPKGKMGRLRRIK